MSKLLTLNKNYSAIVDDIDFEWANQWKWSYSAGYAIRFYGPRDNQKQISLHRALLNPSKGTLVDHINRNGLDNRRSNLRECTASQNNCNQKIRKDNSTGYRGVVLHKSSGLYMARLKKGGKYLSATYHKTAKDAAMAYNVAARKHHGKFANLNVIKE